MLQEIRLGSIVKQGQLEKIVDKVWGHEEWIVNNAKYCGKKMVFKACFQCSMHHHKIKEETFYVQQGRLVLETETNGAYDIRLMTPGDIAHIKPLTWHRLTALDNAEVFEFSTFHMEEDSYRRTESGRADLAAMGVETW
ncbi:cupin domain-containing protein [bacterium]|nr:cupin domain-containing protein [bacterium]